jgi:hypothetical protein
MALIENVETYVSLIYNRDDVSNDSGNVIKTMPNPRFQRQKQPIRVQA